MNQIAKLLNTTVESAKGKFERSRTPWIIEIVAKKARQQNKYKDYRERVSQQIIQQINENRISKQTSSKKKYMIAYTVTEIKIPYGKFKHINQLKSESTSSIHIRDLLQNHSN